MELLALLSQALGITLVDIDNAMYTTSRISALTERRRLALGLSLGLEFVGRLGLLWLFLALTNETEPLFTIAGFEFTLESIALLTAGGYLLISNSRELAAFLHHDQQQEATRETTQSFSSLMLEMGIVLTIMSIDTVLFITTLTTAIGLALFLLLFSALVRLFFVERLVHFIERYPAIGFFITILLIAIGVELIVQGFGLDVEVVFNILVVIAVVVFVLFSAARKRSMTS